MRAVAFTSLGGPDGAEVITTEVPEVGPNQALLDVAAASVNRHDLLYLEGDFRLEEQHLPFVSGVDVSGEVRRVGENVTAVSPGDTVVLDPMQTCGACRFCRDGPENLCREYSLFHGGFAEQAVVDADRLVALSESADPVAAAALPVAYMTAWHMYRRADVDAGDTVLIPGSTGGVGVAATQLGDVIGVETICTSSSAAKLERLPAFGADTVVQAATADELSEHLAARGPVDAVLNHLGGEFVDTCLSALERGGRMVVCGRTAGQYAEFDVQELFLEHKRIVGSTMGTHADLERIVGFYESGRLDPPIFQTYAFDAAADAFADMKNRELVGNLLLIPGA